MPDATEIKQINTIAHKFGQKLMKSGQDIIKTVYKLNPKVFTRGEVLTFLSDQTGIPARSISLADEKFYVETIDKIYQIIEFDLLDQEEYHADWFDCENFALLFSARTALIYKLNSLGTAFGNIYDPATNKLLFRHGFNLILAHENGILKLKTYEPQTDETMDYKKGEGSISKLLSWKYLMDWILMF